MRRPADFRVVASHGGRYTYDMHRLALVLILAADLATCPVRCAGGVAHHAAKGNLADAGASCCARDDQSTPPASGEGPRDDDCTCQNCVCEGAVVPTEYGQTSHGREQVSWIRWDRWSAGGPPKFVSLTPWPPDASASRTGGRDARIAFQSLLN